MPWPTYIQLDVKTSKRYLGDMKTAPFLPTRYGIVTTTASLTWMARGPGFP